MVAASIGRNSNSRARQFLVKMILYASPTVVADIIRVKNLADKRVATAFGRERPWHSAKRMPEFRMLQRLVDDPRIDSCPQQVLVAAFVTKGRPSTDQ
jgi:hypothetical protein